MTTASREVLKIRDGSVVLEVDAEEWRVADGVERARMLARVDRRSIAQHMADLNKASEMDPADALAALEKGLTNFCKAQKIDNVWTVGLAKFRETTEGEALKRAYDEAMSDGTEGTP